MVKGKSLETDMTVGPTYKLKSILDICKIVVQNLFDVVLSAQ